MTSMEIFRKDGEHLEILEEKIDDVIVSGPMAVVKIIKSLKSKKLMARIQAECEWSWKEKQRELLAAEAEKEPTSNGGKIDFESGKVQAPKLKKSESTIAEISKMVASRIKVLKKDIILEDDQNIVKKLTSLLSQMRIYDDENKEFLS